MPRPPRSEPSTRKTIILPDSLWDDVALARKASPGRVPSETEMVRILLREALAARFYEGKPNG